MDDKEMITICEAEKLVVEAYWLGVENSENKESNACIIAIVIIACIVLVSWFGVNYAR